MWFKRRVAELLSKLVYHLRQDIEGRSDRFEPQRIDDRAHAGSLRNSSLCRRAWARFSGVPMSMKVSSRNMSAQALLDGRPDDRADR